MSEGVRYQIEEIDSDPKTSTNGGIPQPIIDYIAKAKPHIIILTPCYNSSMYVTYTESLLQTMFMCKDLGINITSNKGKISLITQYFRCCHDYGIGLFTR